MKIDGALVLIRPRQPARARRMGEFGRAGRRSGGLVGVVPPQRLNTLGARQHAAQRHLPGFQFIALPTEVFIVQGFVHTAI